MKLNEMQNLIKNKELTQEKDYIRPQDLQKVLFLAGIPCVNLYQEIEMNSRYVNAHKDQNCNGDIIQLHSHSFYEMLYTRSGTPQYLLGTQRYSLKQGDIVFVPPGLSHRPLMPEAMKEPYRRYVIWLSAEYMEQICSISSELSIDHAGGRVLRTFGTSIGDTLHEHFRQAVDESTRKAPGWQTALYANALMTLVCLDRAFCDTRTRTLAAEKQELLDDVLTYIKNHLADKITLKDTAKKFLVSESTISQLFSKRLEVSFYRCVTQHRLIAAKNLILEGDPPGTVYNRVGFADYSAFYRAFKQEYGISPKEFRNTLNAATVVR